MRSIFDILRDMMQGKSAMKIKDRQRHREERDSKSRHELKMIKHLETVADVFKKSAERVGKTGEKEWMNTLRQQSIVIEEVIAASNLRGSR